MSDLERRTQQAFDAIKAPEPLVAQTLARIESMRAAPADAATNGEPSHSAPPAPAPESCTIIRPRRKRRVRAFAGAIAACLALACVGVVGHRAYAEPTAFIDLDINPSIELTVNRFERIVDTQPINEDGEALLQSCPSLSGMAYDEALSTLLESDALKPYVSAGDLVAIDIAGDDTAQVEQLQAESKQQLAQLPCQTQCHRSDAEAHASAHHAGMGMGRYRAASELIALDDTYTLEECAHMSMRELHDACTAAENAGAHDANTQTEHAHHHGADH